MSDIDRSQDHSTLDVNHEDGDQPTAESQREVTTQRGAESDTTRQDLKAELESEFFGSIPSVQTGLLPLSAPLEPKNITNPEEGGGGKWENYSRYELWKLYETAIDTALTRGVEIDGLNRVIEAQEEVAKDKLRQACDAFNREVTDTEARLKERNNACERELIAQHRKELGELHDNTNKKIAQKESEREEAERQAKQARVEQQETYKNWARLSAVLASAVVALGMLVYYQRVRYRDDLQHAQDIEAQLQSDLAQAQGLVHSLPPPHPAGSAPAVPSALPTGDKASQQEPSIAQQYHDAARMLRKMHVWLPAHYEQMQEFQQYSQALIQFNAALAPVPLAHRASVVFAAHRDEKTQGRPQVCEADFVAFSGVNRALYIKQDAHEDTRTDLQAEAVRLGACVRAIRNRVYYEWSHPEVDWDQVQADQEVAKKAATQPAR